MYVFLLGFSFFFSFVSSMIQPVLNEKRMARATASATYFRLSCMQTFKYSRSCCPWFNFAALQISQPEIHSIRESIVKRSYIEATFDELTEWIRRRVQTTCDTSNSSPLFLSNNGASRSRVRRGVCHHKATPPWREKGLIAIQSSLELLSSVPTSQKRRDRLICSLLIESIQWIRQPIESAYSTFILSISSFEKTRLAINV